ncbi:MAG: methylmalonyl-CoA mutase [Ardenticatenales bacterium]|nr:methylmalonyl-CoA mutase [Ardenticatenales bacterium]
MHRRRPTAATVDPRAVDRTERPPVDANGDPTTAWRNDVLAPFVARTGLRRPSFATDSGLPLDDIDTPADIAGLDVARDLGLPGAYPFTRGIYPSMYRGRLWTMRQYAGFASAAESNARYRYLLDHGQTGLSVAFDLPTQIGYDPDHAMAAGEVGKVGVSISSLADMEVLFDAIPLDRVSTSMTINATASVLLALYVAVGKQQGVPMAALKGTVQNDVLKEYIARGTYIYPPAPSLRLITDMFRFCADGMPGWNPISISGYHIREAGATAPQEIAFTLANAIAYVDAAHRTGLDVDRFMPQLSFFFVAQNNLLEEVAKFRAARRLWARIARDRFGAKDPRSMMLRFHTQTAGVALTAQQPTNNVVRVAIQALAAVLGGTQSLHTNSMDEALGLPTEEAVKVALRTQQILASESGVADVVDPLAGSYLVERLTDELEAEAAALIASIDGFGGALAAIESGWTAAQIADSAYRLQREVEVGERDIVGVNRYVDDVETSPPVLRVDEAVGRQRAADLAALRARRDGAAAANTLDALRAAAASEANLMPPIIACVEAYATLGEICDVLRAAFGEYRPAMVL